MNNVMRKTMIMAALLVLGAGAAVQADPLPNPPPKVLPDPSPRSSHDFPAQTATAGTADPGHQLASLGPIDLENCSALEPCAIPPPALHQVEPVPARADPG